MMNPVWQIVIGAASALAFTGLLVWFHDTRSRIRRSAAARWLRELGLLLKHHVPLTIALVAAGNDAPRKLAIISYRFRKSVNEGEMLSLLLAQEFALPQSVLALTAAGEACGTLPEALMDAAELLMSHGRRGIGQPRRQIKAQTDHDQEQQRIYEVAASIAGEPDQPVSPEEEVAPLVRIAHSILAQAIKSGAGFIEFEPVRAQRPPRSDEYQDEEEWRLMEMEVGPQLLVSFGRDRDRWEAMRIPKYIVPPLYRRLKAMAEVPYWQKPPVNGRIAVRLGEKDYDMLLDTESHPLGEKLRLEIKEAEVE